MLSSFGQGQIFGSRTGAGAPWVLALHGWRRTHADFDAVLGGGAEAVSAISLDLPGFGGATPPPPEAWGSADYASAISPVLADMVAEVGRPVVVLGHSYGGTVCVGLAARWPELVGAVVLSGVPRLARGGAPSGGTPPSSKSFRLGRALYRRGLIGESAMDKLRDRHGSADYRAAEGVMRQVLVKSVNERYEGLLADLVGPVELVWGELDTAAPLAEAQRAAELLGERGRLTVCPGVGHFTVLEAPEALRQALERHRPSL